MNAALALVGRGSPDHEFYRAMYLELVNTTPEPPGGMLALAAARAEAISQIADDRRENGDHDKGQ